MLRVAVALVLVALVAGCGSGQHASKVLTIPAYGQHPATTEAVSQGSPAFCRTDAREFAQAAQLFVGHSTNNAFYPADLYYMNIRGVWTDFVAHGCSPAYLAPTLTEQLTKPQRTKLAAYLPAAMAATVKAGLAHSSG